MLRFDRVESGEGAALGCARCAAPAPAVYRPASEIAGALAALVAAWPGGPGPNVLVTGPEPLLHPEFPALIEASARAGFRRIGLETDGSALAHADTADNVLREGVRHLHVRIVPDNFSGRPGLMAEARQGIAAYLTAAETAKVTVAVTAVLPVCRHTYASLPATIAEIASWGVHAVRLIGSGDVPEQAAPLVAAACDTGMVNRLWVEADGTVPLPVSHALHTVLGATSNE